MFIYKTKCMNKSKNFYMGLCINDYSKFENLIDTKSYLSRKELSIMNTINSENLKLRFQVGRYTAKNSIKILLKKEINLRNLIIEKGAFNQPVLKSKSLNLDVSLSHSTRICVAIAFPREYPMGIDVERIVSDPKYIINILTRHEKELLVKFIENEHTMTTLLWSAKEALSKTIKTGLTIPIELLEISEIKKIGDRYFTVEYTNFIQYKTISFVMGGEILSITYPKNIEIDFLSLLKKVEIMKGEKNATFV